MLEVLFWKTGARLFSLRPLRQRPPLATLNTLLSEDGEVARVVSPQLRDGPAVTVGSAERQGDILLCVEGEPAGPLMGNRARAAAEYQAKTCSVLALDSRL